MNVTALLQWYSQCKREMPWRETTDPYRIWISEVMLQQTRVDTVTPYYERFLARFPDVCALANASQHDLLNLWEGLGYYSRARNLHQAAKQVCEKHRGEIPSDYAEFRALKGVGPYTAAAVMSISFKQPYAVMDGNVIRVFSRYFGISEDIRSASTTVRIQSLTDSHLPVQAPDQYNQAVMELGATVCKPKNPTCQSCPLSDQCVAYRDGTVAQIPFKSPKAKVPHHRIVVGIVSDADGNVLIARRPNTVMLGGLWEFPGGKVEPGESDIEALRRELREELGVEIDDIRAFTSLKHAYSHFKISMEAYHCTISDGIPKPMVSNELKWVRIDELEDYPFPKANRTLTRALCEQRS